jgi:hypothetical protein
MLILPAELLKGFVGKDSLFGKAVIEAAVELRKLGGSSVTVAQLLDRAIVKIDKSRAGSQFNELEYDPTAPDRLRTVTKTGSYFDAIAHQIATSAILQTGGVDLVRKINPGMSEDSMARPASDNVFAFINRLMPRVQEIVADQTAIYAKASNPEGAKLVDWAEISKRMQRVALTLSGAGDALLIFKDRLFEVTTSLYMQIAKINAEKDFSNRLGLGYDEHQARYDLDKSMFSEISTKRAQAAVDIAKLQNELENAQHLQFNAKGGGLDIKGLTDLFEGQDFSNLSPDDLKDEVSKKVGERISKISAKITAMNMAFKEAFIDQAITISKSLPEGSRDSFMKSINGYFGTAGIDNVHYTDDAQNFFANDARTEKDVIYNRKMTASRSSANLQFLERQLEIQKTLDELDVSMTGRQEKRDRIDSQSMANKLADLQIQKQFTSMTDDEFNTQAETIVMEAQRNSLIARRNQLTEAEVNLQRQGLENLRNTVDGTMRAIGDLNAFGAIFDPLNKDKGQAFRTYVLGIFKGASAPFSDRMAQNFSTALYESLAKKAGIVDLFKTPELAMQAKITEAGTLVADAMGSAIYYNGMEIVNQLRQALGVSGPASVNGPISTTGGMTPTSGGSSKKAMGAGQSLIIGGAGMVGQLAGTAAGHGNGGAQIGSQFGSAAGMILGSFAGNPFVGEAIGAFLGGIAGGALGGLFGGGSKTDRVVNSLDAIAFNTREQISAIEQSTDRLLNPQSTLFGLPSNFNVPSYSPQFGGVGGGTSFVINLGGINVGAGANMGDLEQAVENAVSKAINTGRSTSPRAVRRY